MVQWRPPPLATAPDPTAIDVAPDSQSEIHQKLKKAKAAGASKLKKATDEKRESLSTEARAKPHVPEPKLHEAESSRAKPELAEASAANSKLETSTNKRTKSEHDFEGHF